MNDKIGKKVYIESTGEMLSFDLVRGTFDLIDSQSGLPIFSQATMGFNEKTMREAQITCNVIEKGLLFSLFFEKEKIEMSVRVTLHPRKRVFFFDTSLKNFSDTVYRISSITPFHLFRDEGGFLFMNTISAYSNGMISWEKSRVHEMGRESLKYLESHCMSALEDRTQSLGILIAFVSFRRAFSKISIEYERGCKKLTAVSSWDGIYLAPRKGLKGERFVLSITLSGREALELWAEIAGEEMQCPAKRTSLVGWCSWYHAYHHIDEQYILRNLEKAAEAECFKYFQIDDGYQESEGNWLKSNEKFPRGVPFLITKIREKGFLPGLWVAPFMVSRESPLFKDHPDWLIHDSHGKPLPLIEWRKGQMYGLDCSHPKVREWLYHIFSIMKREWNVGMFKLDFLYLAAMPGGRYHKYWTGARCYRTGLETIREALGNDTFILGCGALLGHSMGLVDAMRISGDVGAAWYGDMSVSTSISNTLTRYFTHNRVWMNDPDCLILRDVETGLTPEEVKTLVTVVGLSGGLVATGDDLTRLSPQRLTLMKKIIPAYRENAVPVNLFSAHLPDVFNLRIEKPFGIWHVVGIINLRDDRHDMVFDISSLSMRKKEYLVFDFWENIFLGKIKGRIILAQIPPHGVKVLCIRAFHGHPQLVSTDFHITQGGVEIKEYSWFTHENILSITVFSEVLSEGSLLFHIPSKYKVRDFQCSASSWSKNARSDGLLEVRCQFTNRFVLKIHFYKE